jgi:hypothetical protein
MIVSAWVSGQERALFRLIEKEVTPLDTTTVANRKGQRWIVKVRRAGPHPSINLTRQLIYSTVFVSEVELL